MTVFIASKRKKHLGINLAKTNVENLYDENCKIPMQEIKENLNTWRNLPHSWTRRLSVVKMSVLPQLISRVKKKKQPQKSQQRSSLVSQQVNDLALSLQQLESLL